MVGFVQERIYKTLSIETKCTVYISHCSVQSSVCSLRSSTAQSRDILFLFSLALRPHVRTLVTSPVHPQGQAVFQVFQFFRKATFGNNTDWSESAGPGDPSVFRFWLLLSSAVYPLACRTPSCGSLFYIEVEFLHLLPAVSASSVVGR